MAEVLLTRQLIEGFTFNSGYGSYHNHTFPAPFSIFEGKRYLVYWDGKIYESVAYAFTYGIYSVIGIGNPMQAGAEDNGEPYAISYNEEYGTLDYFSTEDSESHTISVTLLDEKDAPIFCNHSLSFFFASMFGMYLWETYGDTENYPNPKLFDLYAGETYRVVWDGVPYDCVGIAVDSGGISGIGLGNFGLLDMDEITGEPFVLGVFADGSDTACLTSDEGATHSVIIYRLISTGNEIVLKNYSGTFAISILYSLIATVICLVIAYPFAYVMSRKGPSAQRVMMMLVMLPQWMNLLIRTYSWMNILEKNGLINNLLGMVGIEPLKMIGTPGAVIFGMIYNYLPYMILPIYTVMSKIDTSLLESAEDLGSNALSKLRRVIFPLSIPGVVSGITMVFVPCVSTFYISQKLGGGKIMLVGDVIERQIQVQNNYNLGSALSLVLMIFILISMAVINRFSDGNEEIIV